MPITLNGTTGVVTPGATVGSITGILKATSGVVSQAVAGSDYGQLTLATAQTASGTAVDFTGIPSWAKRITVMLNGVSTNGGSNPLIQIGSGSITTTGYSAGSRDTTVTIAGGGYVYTTGFGIASQNANFLLYGHMNLSLSSSNLWVSSHTIYMTQGQAYAYVGGGSVSLSGALDRLRLTTVNGTDAFDAGTINISFE